MNFSDMSSDDLWASLERADNPEPRKPRTPEQVLWEIRLHDAEHEAARTEALYMIALEIGSNESIVSSRKQAMIAAKDVVELLRRERREREQQ